MTRTLIVATLVMLAGASGATQQKEWAFPHTRGNGRATPEYRHDELHVVVNYDYSQRNHKTKWLLLDMAAASRQPFVLHKNDIVLETPDGRTLPVASQQEILDDGAGITQLLQNAQIWRRQLQSYFNRGTGFGDTIRFQAFPPGAGTVSDEIVVKDDGIAIGPMFFRTPVGSWDAGTYRLQIRTKIEEVALPIRLE